MDNLRAVLEIVGGNKAQAAQILGLDRATLYRRLGRHALRNGAAPAERK